MPINCEGNHWVLAVISLNFSTFTVFDSLHSESRRKNLYKHMREWTKVLNRYLSRQGFFQATNRGAYNFGYFYNDIASWGFMPPQQENGMDCGVIVCWLATQFCKGAIPPPPIPNTARFFAEYRYTMAHHFYATRCEDTTGCGYD